jgi:hypothetical protein
MKHTLDAPRTVAALVFTLSLFLTCVARSPDQTRPKGSAPEPPPPKPVSSLQAKARLDMGKVVGSTYINNYFGLRVTLPANWIVQSDEVKERVERKGKEMLDTKDAEKRAELDAAMQHTYNLLTVSKLPFGTPGQFNALFVVVAEAVSISTDESQYFSSMKEVFRYSRIPISIERDVHTETIGGVQFSALTIKLGQPGMISRQTYYVKIKKGYAIGFITTLWSESDADALEGILKTVKLN